MSDGLTDYERQMAHGQIDWKKKYEEECERSMMAGSQLSALRLQLKDAEKRATRPEGTSIAAERDSSKEHK